MNTPQTIESGAGLLKNSYDTGDALGEALKRKREKIMQTKGMLDPDKANEPEIKP